jgi:hypothetical protein
LSISFKVAEGGQIENIIDDGCATADIRIDILCLDTISAATSCLCTITEARGKESHAPIFKLGTMSRIFMDGLG